VPEPVDKRDWLSGFDAGGGKVQKAGDEAWDEIRM